jgi:hypothetical protein
MHKKDRCPSLLNKSFGIDLKVTSGGIPLELLQPELELSPFPGVSFSRLVRVLTSNRSAIVGLSLDYPYVTVVILGMLGLKVDRNGFVVTEVDTLLTHLYIRRFLG